MNRSERPGSGYDALLASVRAGCKRELEQVRASGMNAPALQGQLVRPLIGCAAAGGEPDAALWSALLAVQLAHDASLLHDDVIDGAVRRRGQPTVVSARGLAAALVEGDHLLTTSYRLAARTGSLALVELFARAVERTVAGERRQHELRGRVLEREAYEEVVLGKSGELIGCAFAAAAVLRKDERAPRFFEVGRRIGLCYQLMDDLLDYCEGAETGKQPYGDWEQRIWTWPLALLPGRTWPTDRDALRRALGAPDDQGRFVLERALDELRIAFVAVRREVRELLPEDRAIDELLDGWLEHAGNGVRRTLSLLAAAAAPSTTSPSAQLPPLAELQAYFARNSRSFAFAARLLPGAQRARVADLYAFCRVTDDLADADGLSAAEREARLSAWAVLSRHAYERGNTGVVGLDRVMREAAAARVPFAYVEELIAGMRMDLTRTRYESLADLRTYTHRVASVVGLWLTRLWGVHERGVLERAADLGHAMQLTNIVRDVGEDWRRGRVYLPRDLMHGYGVDDALLERLAGGEPPPARYRALLEELMAVADAYYERAFTAIPALPPFARAAVAVAAEVYRGIHAAVRANGYDNLNRRAHTSPARKLALAARALWRLGGASRPRTWRPARVAGFAVLAAALFFSLALGLNAQQTRSGRAVSSPALRMPPAALTAATSTDAAAFRGTSSFRDAAARQAALDGLRAAYRAAVKDRRAVAAARDRLSGLRREQPALAERHRPLLTAYEGALELLRARDGSWPYARWRDARRGLKLLDAAVAAAPADLEVRYLRLISSRELPGIFDRGDTVREDVAALVELVPQSAATQPANVVRAVVQYLLAYGELDPSARARVQGWAGA